MLVEKTELIKKEHDDKLAMFTEQIEGAMAAQVAKQEALRLESIEVNKNIEGLHADAQAVLKGNAPEQTELGTNRQGTEDATVHLEASLDVAKQNTPEAIWNRCAGRFTDHEIERDRVSILKVLQCCGMSVEASEGQHYAYVQMKKNARFAQEASFLQPPPPSPETPLTAPAIAALDTAARKTAKEAEAGAGKATAEAAVEAAKAAEAKAKEDREAKEARRQRKPEESSSDEDELGAEGHGQARAKQRRTEGDNA